MKHLMILAAVAILAVAIGAEAQHGRGRPQPAAASRGGRPAPSPGGGGGGGGKHAKATKVFGRDYDKDCVKAALESACLPTGGEFASEVARVPGVGMRVSGCAEDEIARCAK